MTARFLCYKNVKNMKVTVGNNLIGSKNTTFINKIQNTDDIYLYCKGHVWAKLKVVSEGFEDSVRVWEDDIYPYRFKVKVEAIIQKPLSIDAIGGAEFLRNKFGPQWGFKVLFTPNELPVELVKLINEGFDEIDKVNISEFDQFFSDNILFGLKGKKLEIEKEKLKENHKFKG